MDSFLDEQSNKKKIVDCLTSIFSDRLENFDLILELNGAELVLQPGGEFSASIRWATAIDQQNVVT